MTRQIASGLALLHKNHILHRDIKSMNILVTDQFDCKLTDFGMSKLIGDQEIFNTANAGTPLWMAPEVRGGLYNFSADIFSLGLVLFELFENRLPDWDRTNSCVVLPQVYNSLPIVARCLQKSSEHRPTAHDVVSLIDEVVVIPSLRSLRNNFAELLLKAENNSLEVELCNWINLLTTKSIEEIDQNVVFIEPEGQQNFIPAPPNPATPSQEGNINCHEHVAIPIAVTKSIGGKQLSLSSSQIVGPTQIIIVPPTGSLSQPVGHKPFFSGSNSPTTGQAASNGSLSQKKDAT